jgi:cytochrome c553
MCRWDEALFGACLAVALPAQAADGERAAQLCLLCHKPGNVTASAPLLEGQPARYLEAQIRAYQLGTRKDPAMASNVGRLKDKEVRAIARYFADRPVAGRFAVDPERAAAGKQRAATTDCHSCHGRGYRGADVVPRLAGQNPAYIASQIEAFASGTRRHPTPISLAAAAAETLAAYFAALD